MGDAVRGGRRVVGPRGAVLAAAAIVVVLAVLAVAGVFSGGGSDTASSASANTPLTRPSCPVSTLLVPSCGRWWGVAPLADSGIAVAPAVAREERLAGRVLDVVHVYHINSQLFPTADERAVSLAPGHPRLLLINWKPATGMTWAQVAAGAADPTIDREAAYLRATYRHRFFLAIWHEPENDVQETAGSGRTAADYAAMYRHVVQRLRSDGVSWAVTVMDYIGFDKWALQPWFDQLWPGNGVVDWIGLDPYDVGPAAGSNTLRALVDTPSGSFPGYYTWAVHEHPGVPVMLAEWGAAVDGDRQADLFTDMRSTLGQYPALRALLYFDLPDPSAGQPRTSLAAGGGAALDAYRALGRSAAVVAPAVPLPG